MRQLRQLPVMVALERPGDPFYSQWKAGGSNHGRDAVSTEEWRGGAIKSHAPATHGLPRFMRVRVEVQSTIYMFVNTNECLRHT